MKDILKLFVFLLAGVLTAGIPHAAVAQQDNTPGNLSPLARLIRESRDIAPLVPVQPFLAETVESASRRSKLKTLFSQGLVFQANKKVMATLYRDAPTSLSFAIPGGKGETLELELVKVDILASDFQVLTSGKKGAAHWSPGRFYRGIVKGKPHSVAAISVFENSITGMVSDEASNKSLAPLPAENDAAATHYVFYEDKDLKTQPVFQCGAESEDAAAIENESGPDLIPTCETRVARIYFEADYALYQKNNFSVPATANFFTSLFNQAAAVYAVDNIVIKISQLKVWTTPDPYAGLPTREAVLSLFATNMKAGYTGDMAHLLVQRGLGGLASVDSLCNPHPGGRTGISSGLGNFLFPANYTYEIRMLSHELGHTLGSPHTQWCGWSGGAIDGCATPEGTCTPGPIPTNGGTIMSYCAGIHTVGVNFSLGFGPQPGARIRLRVKTCCEKYAGPSVMGISSVTSKSAYATWTSVSGASSYKFGYRPEGAGDFKYITVTGTSYALSGLTAGKRYECRVAATCYALSDWTVEFFTTTPVPVTPYCTAKSYSSAFEWISKVNLGTYSKSSGNNGGYGDFTTLTWTIKQGQAYTMAITPTFNGIVYKENVAVWIDFNQNNLFDGAGEKVFSAAGTSTMSGTVAIPYFSKLGKTRMRVVMCDNVNQLSFCDMPGFGEVEDYTVDIQAGTNYCSASFSNFYNFMNIAGVKMSGSEKTSSYEGGYSNYTNFVFLVDKKTYSIFITKGSEGASELTGYAVWIDYNGNGNFTDPGEQACTIGPSSSNPVTGTIKIPSTTTYGTTLRMRVSMQAGAIPASPCGNSFKSGEVEDYAIKIVYSGPSAGDSEPEGGEDAAFPEQSGERTARAVVENIADNFLKIYPNPATDYITLEAGGQWENATVQILSATGQVVKTMTLTGVPEPCDISGFSPGVYFVRCQNTRVRAVSFVKQ